MEIEVKAYIEEAEIVNDYRDHGADATPIRLKKLSEAIWEEEPSHEFCGVLVDIFREIGKEELSDVVLDYMNYTDNPGNGRQKKKESAMKSSRLGYTAIDEAEMKKIFASLKEEELALT